MTVNQSQNKSVLDTSTQLKKNGSNLQRESQHHLHFWGLPSTDTALQRDVNHINVDNDRIDDVFLGEGHLFIVTKSKAVYGFGDNSFSQINKDLPQKVEKPQLVRFSNRVQVSKIFCGCDYTYVLAN